MITSSRHAKQGLSWKILRAAILTAPAILAVPGLAGATTLYWDSDATATGNNTTTGAGLGFTGSWDASSLNWYDGTSDVAWASGNDAIFWGTAGTVTLAAAQSASSLSFKTNGYTVTGSTLTLSGPSVAVDPNVTATLSSVVAGTAGITKSGTGTLLLTGTNTYTGKTTINGGTLKVSSASSPFGPNPTTGFVADQLGIDGGTVAFAQSGSYTLGANRGWTIGSGGATIDMTGGTVQMSAAKMTGGSSGAPVTITVTGPTATGSNYITGTAATLFGMADNTTTLFAKWVLRGGEVRPDNGGIDKGFGGIGYSSFVSDAITLDGGSIRAPGSFVINANRGIVLTGNGGELHTLNTNSIATYAGIISGSGAGALKIVGGEGGAGVRTILSAANTYTNPTIITSYANPSTVNLTGSLASTSVTINPAGAGTAASTLNVSGSLASTTALNLAANATVNFSNASQALGSISGDGTINLGSNPSFVLTVGGNNTSTTFAGVIAQTGGLTKVGRGFLTITNPNPGISGAVKIVGSGDNDGYLRIDEPTNIGNQSVTNTLTLESQGIIQLSEDMTMSRAIIAGTGGGRILVEGTDGNPRNVTFSGAVTTSGGLSKTGNGDLTIENGVVVDGAGSLNVNGGRVVLNTAQRTGGWWTINNAGSKYMGGTTIAAGARLDVGVSGGTTGDLPGYLGMTGNRSLVNNGTLNFMYYNGHYQYENISGSGVVNTLGGGSTTLLGQNNPSGPIYINNGTHIRFWMEPSNGDGAMTGTGAVWLGDGRDGELASEWFVNNKNNNFPGKLTGIGGMFKSGNGILTFSGSTANDNAGLVDVRGGELDLDKPDGVDAIGVGGLKVGSGTTVKLIKSNQINNSAALTLAGGTFNANGQDEVLGKLYMDASSTIDMDAGSSVVSFAGNTGATWTGVLSVTNWSGSDELLFAAVSGAQLNQIVFVDPDGFEAGTYAARLSPSNPAEIVPVPEPTSIALLGIGSLALRRRRRT